MKLYRARVPDIAGAIIRELTEDGSIEVEPENKAEAELDLVAIMEEYLRREMDLRNNVRESMSMQNIPYDQYGKTRSRVAQDLGHPLGDDVERFLARQFVENFMISRWIEEVYEEDATLYKKTIELLRGFHVDERAIREEAKEKIKNVKEGTVDYELALSHAIKDIKKRQGLIQ